MTVNTFSNHRGNVAGMEKLNDFLLSTKAKMRRRDFMDDTVLKVALAGLLHDIGKLAEDAMYVTPEYLNANAGLYQPFYNGHHTHRHAVYTAAFVEQIEKLLPRQLNKAQWGLDDPFINVTAGHHVPQTPLQWIIAIADRLSSGWDRKSFDEYNQAIAFQDYKKTRLLPLFEGLLRSSSDDIGKLSYRYPLKEISPLNIFPGLKTEVIPEDNEKALEEYKDLFDEFVDALERILHKEENLPLWFEHLDSLMLIYTSAIPAARAGKVVPDVSLYDHLRSTAAIAASLYLYHRDTDSLSVGAIREREQNKFLLIGGDFYGIQDFIFSDTGTSARHRSKILRGRSFAVSLICELAADMICRGIGLPSTSVLLNAAGKFTILAPNTGEAKQAVYRAKSAINEWLIEKTIGESAFGVSMIEAKPADFESGNFLQTYERLSDEMARQKFRKFDPATDAGVVEGFLDSFDNTLNPPICPYCGKRPSSRLAEAQKKDADDQSLCAVCRDHIFLGENIVRKNRIAITVRDADIKGDNTKLLEPIFGEYQVAFIDGGLTQMAKNGQLLKYWDIAISVEGQVAKDVTSRFINGYVPVYDEEDHYDDRILEGVKSEEKKLELVEAVKENRPKTFAHLACKAMNPLADEKKKYVGIQALGILKADVDHLGILISCGIPKERFSMSRLATLSRQMNAFFCLYLPYALKTEAAFKDIYTVFAGGDDLFLIGPWNRILDLAGYLKERFEAYVCKNPEVHFSAGISLQKANTPVAKMADDAESALDASKNCGRNRITVFGETVKWTEFEDLQRIAKTMETWRSENLVNNAELFRLNRFIAMAGLEKTLMEEKEIHLDDMEALKWRALFRYSAERNIGKNVKDAEKKEAIRQDFNQVAAWLENYGGALRIALWNVIYNNR